LSKADRIWQEQLAQEQESPYSRVSFYCCHQIFC